jgi:hypothetical protein
LTSIPGRLVNRNRAQGGNTIEREWRRAPRITRLALNTGFITAALLVGGGVFVLARSIAAADVPGMFIGLIGIGAGWIGRLTLRMLGELLAAARATRASQQRSAGSLAAIAQTLESMERSESHVELSAESSEQHALVAAGSESAVNLDLSDLGNGELQAITAARLDRNVFPRLAAALDEEAKGPVSSGTLRQEIPDEPMTEIVALSEGVRNKNIFRQWQGAISRTDLPAARAIHATLSQALDAELLEPMTLQLRAVEESMERVLRKRFSSEVHTEAYAAALKTGEEICRLFPDRRIAAEFRQLRPLLARRVV